jgi:hypothetical protein
LSLEREERGEQNQWNMKRAIGRSKDADLEQSATLWRRGAPYNLRHSNRTVGGVAVADGGGDGRVREAGWSCVNLKRWVS